MSEQKRWVEKTKDFDWVYKQGVALRKAVEDKDAEIARLREEVEHWKEEADEQENSADELATECDGLIDILEEARDGIEDCRKIMTDTARDFPDGDVKKLFLLYAGMLPSLEATGWKRRVTVRVNDDGTTTQTPPPVCGTCGGNWGMYQMPCPECGMESPDCITPGKEGDGGKVDE